MRELTYQKSVLAFGNPAVESMARKARAKSGLRSSLGLLALIGMLGSLTDILSTYFISHPVGQNSVRMF